MKILQVSIYVNLDDISKISFGRRSTVYPGKANFDELGEKDLAFNGKSRDNKMEDSALMAHGSQDLTLHKALYGFSADEVTVTQVVANLGAMTGAISLGYCTEIFGHKLTIIVIANVG
ncbi:Carboxylic acid transporter [Exophiala xenobiotica]|nr:Carboxylic acid transporter [Exophiala xenobiotica]